MKSSLNHLVMREDGGVSGAFCMMRERVIAFICWLKRCLNQMEELIGRVLTAENVRGA